MDPADRFVEALRRFTCGQQSRKYGKGTVDAVRAQLYAGKSLEIVTPWCRVSSLQGRWDACDRQEAVESGLPLVQSEEDAFRRFQRFLEAIDGTGIEIDWYVVPAPSTDPRAWLCPAAVDAYSTAFEAAAERLCPDASVPTLDASVGMSDGGLGKDILTLCDLNAMMLRQRLVPNDDQREAVRDALRAVRSLFHESVRGGGSLADAHETFSRLALRRMGAEIVRVGRTSEALFGPQSSFDDRLLQAFLRSYEAAAEAYNAAVRDHSQVSLDLEHREVPYFVVISGEGNATLCLDPSWKAVDDVRKAIERQAAGKTWALVPKAVALYPFMWTTAREILSEGGAPYRVQSLAFWELLREAGLLSGIGKTFSSVRVGLSALDALSAFRGSIRLPAYLADAFGTTEISAADFSARWRDVRAAASESLTTFSGKLSGSVPVLAELLHARGAIDSSFLAFMLENVRTYRRANERRCDTEHLGRAEASFRNARSREFQGVGLIREVYGDMSAYLRLKAYRAIVQAMRVRDSLARWNERPHLASVLAVPGWLDEIVKTATIRIEHPPRL